jgi:hypothetical protein
VNEGGSLAGRCWRFLARFLLFCVRHLAVLYTYLLGRADLARPRASLSGLDPGMCSNWWATGGQLVGKKTPCL